MTERSHRTPVFWFGWVLALAVLLRLIGLTTRDMWTDEVNTLWTSAYGAWVSGPMYRTAPINFYLTRLTIDWFGPNELGVRIIPFLSGVLTVGLSFWLLKRWIGQRAALVGALVLTLSIWHIYWSQTARHFSFETLLVLLSLHCFMLFWQEGRLPGLIAAAVLSVVAMFTHSSAGFYLVSYLVFIGISWCVSRVQRGFRSDWTAADRKHMLALSVMSIALLIYVPVYITVGSYLLKHREPWNPAWNILGSLAFYVPPMLALPSLAGVISLWRQRQSIAGVLLSMILVPVALVTLASTATIASGSYCLPSLLAVAALVGVGFDRMMSAASSNAARWCTIAVFLGIGFSQASDCVLYFNFYNGMKPRWKEVCQEVSRQKLPGEIFLADEGDVAQYYLGKENAKWFGEFEEEAGASGTVGSPTFPPPAVRGVWYAFYLTDSSLNQKPPQVRSYILSHARLVQLYPLHYGPKDRTLALFHQEMASIPDSRP